MEKLIIMKNNNHARKSVHFSYFSFILKHQWNKISKVQGTIHLTNHMDINSLVMYTIGQMT